MCGGTSKIPRLQKQIANLFSNGEILSSLSPDEVIALGAASQASLLHERWSDEHISTEESKPVRVQVLATNQSVVYTSNLNVCDDAKAGKKELPITLISAGTPIPVRRSHHLTDNIASIVNSKEPVLKVAICMVQKCGSLIEITTVKYEYKFLNLNHLSKYTI